MERQSSRLLMDPGCVHLATDRESVDGPRRSAVDPVLSDTVLAELRAQAPPGCFLCSMDDWEEDWDA
ncbi:MAG TPA: hypothetical protein VJ731_13645 [Terriglobales bacterium]|nr:hypothetical protein [Terriglobales bacterium]